MGGTVGGAGKNGARRDGEESCILPSKADLAAKVVKSSGKNRAGLAWATRVVHIGRRSLHFRAISPVNTSSASASQNQGSF